MRIQTLDLPISELDALQFKLDRRLAIIVFLSYWALHLICLLSVWSADELDAGTVLLESIGRSIQVSFQVSDVVD